MIAMAMKRFFTSRAMEMSPLYAPRSPVLDAVKKYPENGEANSSRYAFLLLPDFGVARASSSLDDEPTLMMSESSNALATGRNDENERAVARNTANFEKALEAADI